MHIIEQISYTKSKKQKKGLDGPLSLTRAMRRRRGRAVGRTEPAYEGVERSGIGAVVALSEAPQIGPCEVRVQPHRRRRRQRRRWAHDAVMARAEEVGQRPPLQLPVHHRAVDAALVSPIRQRLHPAIIHAHCTLVKSSPFFSLAVFIFILSVYIT